MRSRILGLLVAGILFVTASPIYAADDGWQTLTLPDEGAAVAIEAGDFEYEVVSGLAVALYCGGQPERYEGSGIATGPCTFVVPVGQYERVTFRWRPSTWQSVTLDEWGVPSEVDMSDRGFEYRLSGGQAAIYCTGEFSGGFREIPEAAGTWQYLSTSGTVTGPCSLVMASGHSHGDDNHDDHHSEVMTFRWHPAPASDNTTRFILTGNNNREKHRLGDLADGKWRIRNFKGVQVRVWSSEDGLCTERKTAGRIIVTIGEGCDGDIQLRVRNPDGEPYRLWMTKID